MSTPLTLALAALALGPSQSPTVEADVDAALGMASLSAATARFDESILRLFRQGEFTPVLYSTLSENPWRIPAITRVKRSELAGFVGRPSDSLVSGGQWLGWGVRRSLLGNPNAAEEAAAKAPGALPAAFEALRSEGLLTGATPPVTGIPEPTQQAAALVLRVAARVAVMRRLALAGVGDPKAAFDLVRETPEDPAGFARLLRVYRSYEPKAMTAGAHDLLLAAQTAAQWAAAVPATTKYSFSLQTAMGSVILRGGADDPAFGGSSLLLIDTGGNDTYTTAGSNQTVANGLSIAIDTAGDDRYVSDPALLQTPVEKFADRGKGVGAGPAGALLGIAAIVDTQGNDLYRSHRPGLGSGRLGVAALLDTRGNDVYDAYRDSQGFGMFGAGILEDVAGDDVYTGFFQVQGVGQTMGLGYLVDRAGADRYTANLTTLDFPSPQSAQHNVSMAQGAGNGRRADYSDGMSLAGGVGILFDQAGDDQYASAVFGQGVGYWMGVGIVWDSAGRDRYEGQWYVQGASAHFAIGILEDDAGDDEYVAGMNMAQGAGHDFSVGFLRDGTGNDRYQAPNLSLGAGNANGIGWLLEMGGDDTYQSVGLTLGQAAESGNESLRGRALCLGLFTDLGGRDTYPAGLTYARDGERSVRVSNRAPSPAESQLGVFYDR